MFIVNWFDLNKNARKWRHKAGFTFTFPVELSKKQESSRKMSNSALLTMPKPLTVWTTKNSGKFLKSWEYQTIWPASWESCMQVKKQHLELDVEQLTCKIRKEVQEGCILSPWLFNFYAKLIVWNARLDEITSWNQDCWKYQQPQIHRW